MTQVTDEMVAAASYAYEAGEDMRAALEAALAAREPDAGDWAAFGASDAACYKWPEDTSEHKALRAAYIEGAAAQADLIERQAEEIADNEAFVSILQKEVQRLTAERAELIEELRPFVYPIDDAIQRAVALDRARALLERLGAKEVG
jgi:hypothetical protein